MTSLVLTPAVFCQKVPTKEIMGIRSTTLYITPQVPPTLAIVKMSLLKGEPRGASIEGSLGTNEVIMTVGSHLQASAGRCVFQLQADWRVC